MATSTKTTVKPRSSPDAKPARQLLSREERHRQIQRAAAVAFARAGFAGTSMEDVAAEAGVTKLIVYRHFESKEELYRSILERVSNELREEFWAEMEAPHGDEPSFVSRSMLEVARRDPDAVRLLLVHARREPQFADHAAEHFANAVDVADALVGELLADPTIKAWATRTIVSYLIMSLLAWLDEGDPARDDEFVRLATDGLAAMFLAWVPQG